MQGITNETYNVAKHYQSGDWYFSSLFGEDRGDRKHRGIDISLPGARDKGENVLSFLSGTVARKGYQKNGAGHYVVIKQDNGQEQKYFHLLDEPNVKKGQRVSAGQTIGKIGNTGNSFGEHLHVEFWENGNVLDPTPFLKSWANKAGNNTIDFLASIEDKFKTLTAEEKKQYAIVGAVVIGAVTLFKGGN